MRRLQRFIPYTFRLALLLLFVFRLASGATAINGEDTWAGNEDQPTASVPVAPVTYQWNAGH